MTKEKEIKYEKNVKLLKNLLRCLSSFKIENETDISKVICNLFALIKKQKLHVSTKY